MGLLYVGHHPNSSLLSPDADVGHARWRARPPQSSAQRGRPTRCQGEEEAGGFQKKTKTTTKKTQMYFVFPLNFKL